MENITGVPSMSSGVSTSVILNPLPEYVVIIRSVFLGIIIGLALSGNFLVCFTLYRGMAANNMASSTSNYIEADPTKPVNEVVKEYRVIEDGALAHYLQEREIEYHHACNVEQRRTVMGDIQTAKQLQDEEDKRARILTTDEQEKLKGLDGELAEVIQEEVVQQHLHEEDERKRRERRDQEMAKRILEREKRRNRRQQEQDHYLAERMSDMRTSESNNRRKEVSDEELAKRLQDEEKHMLKKKEKHKEHIKTVVELQDEELARFIHNQEMEEMEMIEQRQKHKRKDKSGKYDPKRERPDSHRDDSRQPVPNSQRGDHRKEKTDPRQQDHGREAEDPRRERADPRRKEDRQRDIVDRSRTPPVDRNSHATEHNNHLRVRDGDRHSPHPRSGNSEGSRLSQKPPNRPLPPSTSRVVNNPELSHKHAIERDRRHTTKDITTSADEYIPSRSASERPRRPAPPKMKQDSGQRLPASHEHRERYQHRDSSPSDNPWERFPQDTSHHSYGKDLLQARRPCSK
ncbi:uncharacterized protein LOC143450878 isoform X2 [Clavelina lepadiformis]|uniref:uncharacterized protein LOC143450878 isoform X2 n=1 Tax=Clavelina lepadiformis TaxID=159417 RepID=UPI0040415EA2